MNENRQFRMRQQLGGLALEFLECSFPVLVLTIVRAVIEILAFALDMIDNRVILHAVATITLATPCLAVKIGWKSPQIIVQNAPSSPAEMSVDLLSDHELSPVVIVRTKTRRILVVLPSR